MRFDEESAMILLIQIQKQIGKLTLHLWMQVLLRLLNDDSRIP